MRLKDFIIPFAAAALSAAFSAAALAEPAPNTNAPSAFPTPTQTPVYTAYPVPTQTPVPAQTPVPSQTPVPAQTAAPFPTAMPTQTPVPPEAEQPEPYYSFTPKGNLTLIDDVFQNESYYLDGQLIIANKQFITLQSKNGNYFYLVIDRSGENENVYFLNLVDEADLLALIKDGDIGVPDEPETQKPVSTPKPAEQTENPDASPEPGKTPKGSNKTGLIATLAVILAAGIIFAVVKLKKKKVKVKRKQDIDDFEDEPLDEADEQDDEYEIETDDEPDKSEAFAETDEK